MPAGAERDALGQPVAGDVQQHRGGRQPAAGGGAERDQAHVLHAGVGEHALVVTLPEQQGGGQGEGEHGGTDQQGPGEPGAQRHVRDHLVAQDRGEGHRQQHPGHQRRHRRRGLAVRVGQPGVQRHQPGLGAEPQDDQGDPHPGDGWIQLVRPGDEHRPVQGGGFRDAGLPGGVVDQDGAQEGQGDPGGADDDVLPGGLDRGTGPPVADEEGGDDGGGLDRHPQHAEVGHQDGDGHRGQEGVYQNAVAARAAGVGVPGGVLRRQIGGAGRAGEDRDRADDQQDPRGQGVGAGQPAVAGDRPVPGDADGQHDRAAQDRGGGDKTRPGGGRPPAEHGVAGRGGQRDRDRGGQQQRGGDGCGAGWC